MVWEDILVDRVLNKEELLNGTSHMFSCERENIEVIDCLEAILDVPEAPIKCQSTVLSGQFPLLLSFYINDIVSPRDKLAAIKRFCAVMETACLISDESVNPYTMTQVSAGGIITPVRLDPARLDEMGEYWIKT